MSEHRAVSRRSFLKQSGVLVVAFALPATLARSRKALGTGTRRANTLPPAAERLDSWLVIGRDESITVYAGKVELGTGVSTALRQIVAEELDVPVARIAWVQGDSQRTVDQGRTVGSQSVKRGGAQLRRAAAEARLALFELASARLGVSADQLTSYDRVIAVTGDMTKRVTFGALIGGGRFDREVSGKAPLKRTSSYRVVGKPVPRVDIPGKVTGTHVYVHDVRVPGMVHARVVRPAGIGATLASVDESSVRGLPGVIRVVRKENFVAVVAEREEQAIAAARALKVTWTPAPVLPAQAELFDALRRLPSSERRVGETGEATPIGATTVRATYRWPLQMHASIGPSCGVADVRSDSATVWSATQGAHQLVAPIAALLRMPEDNVRVIWAEGSGCYGHNGSDDASADAALISQIVGRPVRVQWSRADEHGWEPKGPAMLVEMAGTIGADGRIASWTSDVWTLTHGSRPGPAPSTVLAGALSGEPIRPAQGFNGGGERNARTTYRFASERVTAHHIASFPIRTSSFRGLGSPQNSFANESFFDELAVAAKTDPVALRLQHVDDPRGRAVIETVAKRAGWGSAKANAGSGRGFAYVQYDRTEAYVAAVVDVDVNATTGVIRVRRVCIAHDCGLIVNPDGVRNQIEGNVVQAISRTLKEAVRFDPTRVTSTDWTSYPILTFPELPDAIDIDLIDHPDQPSMGAGEAATSPIPAAIANAVFAATGARLREVPFLPDRVLNALKRPG